MTREQFEAIRHFAGEPCECDGVTRKLARSDYLRRQLDSKLCGPCKAKRWLEDGAKLAEGLS